jgi:site-specific DNA-methyltransferase (adenine-specific)
MAVRIEDAGFEIRDMLAWMYGSGFPKSHNVSIAIDKADGVDRDIVGTNSNHRLGQSKGLPPGVAMTGQPHTGEGNITAPATDAAKQWQGWGTALKPAMEPITMARKPFKATVAQNVQEWGTGAINIDGCRIGEEKVFTTANKTLGDGIKYNNSKPFPASEIRIGRFPANVMHDGSENVLEGMGEAARFFYTPKACKDDRDDGCDNNHPTVKPTDLMRYLCRMVTPTGGIVLDPFTGSGSTGRGAVLEGFRFIGCEMDADYIEIAKARILATEKAYQPCLTFD